jgi:hypothetical protein
LNPSGFDISLPLHYLLFPKKKKNKQKGFIVQSRKFGLRCCAFSMMYLLLAARFLLPHDIAVERVDNTLPSMAANLLVDHLNPPRPLELLESV